MPESCSLFDTLHTVEFPRQDGCVINGDASSDFSRVHATKAPTEDASPLWLPSLLPPPSQQGHQVAGLSCLPPLEIDEKWLAIGMKTYKGVAGKYALRCKALQNFLYALFPTAKCYRSRVTALYLRSVCVLNSAFET